MDESNFEVFNPQNKPVEELSFIYGFNNGGRSGWFEGILIAEDGEIMGEHICSSEGFMYGDLGILKGYRSDRHATFQKKYPEGYRMTFVTYENVPKHEGLKRAFDLHAKLPVSTKEA